MKSAVITLSLITTFLAPASAVCHACFDHVCYTRKKVFEGAQLSGQIAIDRMDNLLHLHYKDIRNTDYTAVVDLNFDNLKMNTLPVAYSFARAINQHTGEVYFSGTKGIYKYSTMTKQTERFAHFSKTIWHMQFKDKLYFSEYQKQGLHYIDGNRTVCISALTDYVIDDFIVDKFDDIYFTSDYLVYRLKKGATKPCLFSKILYSLSTDKNDNAHFLDANTRTLYYLDYPRDLLIELGMFDVGTVVFRMVFDIVNDIIYCDAADDKVYLLYPNYARCSLTKKTGDSKPQYSIN
ncbi:uncharacterized protein LOC114352770 [Ostrinia furnacalis]|uniref:uncharacterized protein LOC114352770 n=1 Tax=Ostrinia furnacalis TaxID=93504 RepID=UPI00103F35ED|nr:uncharacterized protein LOC114352770 [Ostrinia furnacalis]XP_028160292.1 uncharacterized protein LOC114352770 [Ostrinia furnacalis]